MKLIMAKIGARPKGRLIEQHDIIFAVVNSLSEIIPIIDGAWSQVKGKWHIDAWREVTRVDDYRITIIAKRDLSPSLLQENQLFFVNLGGYLPNQFEEFHYKTLVVADSINKAIIQAKKTEFYKQYTFNNPDKAISGSAISHVDDKHLVDIDEIHYVAGLLPNEYYLQITQMTDDEKKILSEDKLHIGYLPIKSLKKLPAFEMFI